MEDRNNKFERDGESTGRLPQYGKKGHKPRKAYSRKESNLDEITTNRIEYWNNSQGFDNVTKFNWNLIAGYPRNMSDFLGTTNQNGVTGTMNPAQIMFIDFYYGPGWASSVNDGVNRGLNKIMAEIRASLSTSQLGFETADLGIFVSATSSIAVNIAYAKKILESYKVWKDKNYAYPRALIKGSHMEYNDIRDNINVYTAKLNALIDMYNNMSIPDIFWLYDRQYALVHNIFVDEDSPFGQMYTFIPKIYYVYDDTLSQATAKELLNVEGTVAFSQLLSIIEEQINSWYGSSDLYQINGTLLRAFKDAPKQQVPYHSIDNEIQPVTDREFLMQIMNMTIMGNVSNVDTLNITQNPTVQNFIIWKPRFSTSGVYNKGGLLLRLYEDDITNEDNMELTRLTNFVADTTDVPYYAAACGSELVSSIRVGCYDAVSDSFTKLVTLTSNTISIPTTGTGINTVDGITKIVLLQPFRYLPPIFVSITAGSGGDLVLGHLGDTYNWMVYPYTDWMKLQEVAYQSIWKPINI